LDVVVEGRAAEAVRVEAGDAPQGRVARQHAVAREALVEREHVVADHPEADEQGAALVARVDRDEEAQRAHEVRGDAQEPLALAKGLAHEIDLVVLEVAQPAVDEARRPARRGTMRGLTRGHLEPALGERP
jgi:hypothetical protein